MKLMSFAAYVESGRKAKHEVLDRQENSGPAESKAAADSDLREQSHREGYEQGYAVAVAEFEELLHSLHSTEADRLEAAKREVLANEAAVFRRYATRELAKFRGEIEGQVSSVLECLFGTGVERRARAETTKLLRDLCSIWNVEEIRIRGEQKHVDVIRQELGSFSQFVSFEISDEPDLSISFNQTTVRTQISDWKQKVERLIEADPHV
jgi:hypothetical protein